jgi:hypothetical protein
LASTMVTVTPTLCIREKLHECSHDHVQSVSPVIRDSTLAQFRSTDLMRSRPICCSPPELFSSVSLSILGALQPRLSLSSFRHRWHYIGRILWLHGCEHAKRSVNGASERAINGGVNSGRRDQSCDQYWYECHLREGYSGGRSRCLMMGKACGLRVRISPNPNVQGN